MLNKFWKNGHFSRFINTLLGQKTTREFFFALQIAETSRQWVSQKTGPSTVCPRRCDPFNMIKWVTISRTHSTEKFIKSITSEDITWATFYTGKCVLYRPPGNLTYPFSSWTGEYFFSRTAGSMTQKQGLESDTDLMCAG